MARNKHPEETINRILDISLKLFLEHGYEHTSIQDIIDNLGGLTKGAIYHHFKSKEDILVAVSHRLNEDYTAKLLNLVRNKREISGLEKLRELFRDAINSSTQMERFQTAPDILSNSKMLSLQLQGIIKETVPQYIKPVIDQGVADGSIKTDYPQELAEVISLLLSIWVNPMIFYTEPEGIWHRILFFRQLLQGVGLDLMDDQMMERMLELSRIYSEKKQ